MTEHQTDGGFPKADALDGAVHRLDDRVRYEQSFELLPLLNASVDITSQAPTIAQIHKVFQANRHFELFGNSAEDADVAFVDGGGVSLTTGTNSGAYVGIKAHQNTKQTQWAQLKLNTDDEVGVGCTFTFGSAIDNMAFAFGLKLTHVDTVATDADQAFFRYESGVNSGKFQCITSTDGTDSQQNTDVAVAASESYRLQLKIQADRTVLFKINGLTVATSPALKADTDLVLTIQSRTKTTAARVVTVRPPLALTKLRND